MRRILGGRRVRHTVARVARMSPAELRVLEAFTREQLRRLVRSARAIHGTLRMGEDPTAPAT